MDEDRWKCEADEKRYIPHHPTMGASQAGMPSPTMNVYTRKIEVV